MSIYLWMLKVHLDEEDGVLAELQKAGNVCLSLPTFYYRRDTLEHRVLSSLIDQG